MTKWKIDTAHATAEFKVKHLGIAWVPGTITGISGDISFNTDNLQESNFSAELDLNTISTGLAQRDGHLKSADFFDVEKFPKMTFKSTSVEKKDESNFIIKGNLTIKETTKEVEVMATYHGQTQKPNMDESMSTVAAFTLKSKLDRRDFGLNWNVDLPGGKLLVGNDVEINIELEAIAE